jgi:hypothetical protein
MSRETHTANEPAVTITSCRGTESRKAGCDLFRIYVKWIREFAQVVTDGCGLSDS